MKTLYVYSIFLSSSATDPGSMGCPSDNLRRDSSFLSRDFFLYSGFSSSIISSSSYIASQFTCGM